VWYGGGRRYARQAIDLTWVALSVLLALVIRDNFTLSPRRIEGIVPYALVCVISAAIVFRAAGLQRTLWRYVSLTDVLHVIAAVTVTLLLALLAVFIWNRLEGVPRAVPVIQWLLLVGGLVGSRIAVRLAGERMRRRNDRRTKPLEDTQHVLIVGVNDITELYLRSVAEFASDSFVVVGILSTGSKQLKGRFLRMHKILSEPENVQRVLAQLEIHGVRVNRIVVTQPFEQLSGAAREALQTVERSSAIKVDWLVESLGLRGAGASSNTPTLDTLPQVAGTAPSLAGENSETTETNERVLPARYHRLKRMIDAAVALTMLIVLAPFIVLQAVLVAIDVGTPLLFWQWRPGRGGRPVKLYKFRTMRGAHDAAGDRIPDDLRSSVIGRFLRRSHLDELPQLYNILVGEMSFVGPRPLLPVDQPEDRTVRLLVRPGLTGWAQVNGGRYVSAEQKASLDIWYIANASLWLDLRILIRTLGIVVWGARPNGLDARAVQGEPEGPKTGAPVGAATETEASHLPVRAARQTV